MQSTNQSGKLILFSYKNKIFKWRMRPFYPHSSTIAQHSKCLHIFEGSSCEPGLPVIQQNETRSVYCILASFTYDPERVHKSFPGRHPWKFEGTLKNTVALSRLPHRRWRDLDINERGDPCISAAALRPRESLRIQAMRAARGFEGSGTNDHFWTY